MRYELTDREWAVIKPLLPNKPRGVPRVMTDACSTASFGSYARARNALTTGHEAAVQMIDTSIVRVHQHAAAPLARP
jgi:hypothetical protein